MLILRQKQYRLTALLCIAVVVQGCGPAIVSPVSTRFDSRDESVRPDPLPPALELDEVARAFAELRDISAAFTEGSEESELESPPENDGQIEPDISTVPVELIDGYARFTILFRRATNGITWTDWKQRVQTLLQQMEQAGANSPPAPLDLLERVATLAERSHEFNAAQNEALAKVRVRLTDYQSATGTLHRAVEELDGGMELLRRRIRDTIAVVDGLKDTELTEEQVQQRITAMLAADGPLGSMFALLAEPNDVFQNGIDLVKRAIEVAWDRRHRLLAALDELQRLVPDPSLEEEIRKFKQKDEEFWNAEKVILAATNPIAAMILLLLSLFSGGGGGEDGGDGGDGEDGEDDGDDGDDGDDDNQTDGKDKDARTEGEETSPEAGDAEDLFALPPDATTLSLQVNDEGRHRIQSFRDSSGRAWLRFFVDSNPEHAVTVKFNTERYSGTDFEEFRAALPDLTLTTLDIGPIENPYAILATFESQTRDGQAFHLEWLGPNEQPHLLSGGDGNPIVLPKNQRPLAVKMRQDGKHSVRFARNETGDIVVHLVFDGKPETAMQLQFTLDDKDVRTAIEERTLVVEQLTTNGNYDSPYPIRLSVSGIDGQLRYLRWTSDSEMDISEN